jgi:hypothetical membrane protein
MKFLPAALLFFSNQFAYFGLAGCALVGLAVLISTWIYRGKRQERFSLFNHFVSELGERGVSAGAQIFNGGLVASGLILLPFVLGLGVHLNNLWGVLATIAGVITALACVAVGLFPMNHLPSHVLAAMIYFRAGLIMVVLYTLAILTQPPANVWVPKWVVLFGALAILSYGSFLVLVRGGTALTQVNERLTGDPQAARPRFWALPAVEWGIFFTTIIWFLAIALVTA